jgi:hypothetical protein
MKAKIKKCSKRLLAKFSVAVMVFALTLGVSVSPVTLKVANSDIKETVTTAITDKLPSLKDDAQKAILNSGYKDALFSFAESAHPAGGAVVKGIKLLKLDGVIDTIVEKGVGAILDNVFNAFQQMFSSENTISKGFPDITDEETKQAKFNEMYDGIKEINDSVKDIIKTNLVSELKGRLGKVNDTAEAVSSSYQAYNSKSADAIQILKEGATYDTTQSYDAKKEASLAVADTYLRNIFKSGEKGSENYDYVNAYMKLLKEVTGDGLFVKNQNLFTVFEGLEAADYNFNSETFADREKFNNGVVEFLAPGYLALNQAIIYDITKNKGTVKALSVENTKISNILKDNTKFSVALGKINDEIEENIQKAKPDSTLSKEFDKLTTEIDTLAQEVDSLNKKLDDLLDENNSLESDNKRLSIDNDILTFDNKRLQEVNETLVIGKDSTISSNKPLIEKNEKLSNTYKTLTESNKSLQKEIDKLSKDKKNLSKNKNTISKNKTKITENNKQLGIIKPTIDEIGNLIKSNETLINNSNEQIKDNEKTISDNKDTIESNETSIGENDSKIDKNASVIEDYFNEIDLKSSNLDEKSDELKKVEDEIFSKSKELDKKNTELQRQKDQLAKDFKELIGKEQPLTDNEIKEYNEELTSIETTSATASKNIGLANTHLENLNASMNKVSDAFDESQNKLLKEKALFEDQSTVYSAKVLNYRTSKWMYRTVTYSPNYISSQEPVPGDLHDPLYDIVEQHPDAFSSTYEKGLGELPHSTLRFDEKHGSINPDFGWFDNQAEKQAKVDKNYQTKVIWGEDALTWGEYNNLQTYSKKASYANLADELAKANFSLQPAPFTPCRTVKMEGWAAKTVVYHSVAACDLDYNKAFDNSANSRFRQGLPTDKFSIIGFRPLSETTGTNRGNWNNTEYALWHDANNIYKLTSYYLPIESSSTSINKQDYVYCSNMFGDVKDYSNNAKIPGIKKQIKDLNLSLGKDGNELLCNRKSAVAWLQNIPLVDQYLVQNYVNVIDGFNRPYQEFSTLFKKHYMNHSICQENPTFDCVKDSVKSMQREISTPGLTWWEVDEKEAQEKIARANDPYWQVYDSTLAACRYTKPLWWDCEMDAKMAQLDYVAEEKMIKDNPYIPEGEYDPDAPIFEDPQWGNPGDSSSEAFIPGTDVYNYRLWELYYRYPQIAFVPVGNYGRLHDMFWDSEWGVDNHPEWFR